MMGIGTQRLNPSYEDFSLLRVTRGVLVLAVIMKVHDLKQIHGSESW
jgi:hypothetical protein